MSRPTSCGVLLRQTSQLRGTSSGTEWELGSPEAQMGYETQWTGSQAKASPGFGVGSATGSGHGVLNVPSCGRGCRGLCSSWFLVSRPPRPASASGCRGLQGSFEVFIIDKDFTYARTHTQFKCSLIFLVLFLFFLNSVYTCIFTVCSLL